MNNRPIDDFSPAALFVRMFYRQTCLADASGFLWRHEGKPFLISNWHNFTGRDPVTGNTLSKKAGIPDRIECVLWKHEESKGKPKRGDTVVWGSYSFPLLDSDQAPIFLEHPRRKEGVDIAVLALDLPQEIVATYLNEQKFANDLPLRAGQDVFIVGYPLGQLFEAPLPVWKRGSIASEPNAPIEGLNKLLVDTATRSGMSGSFVIAQEIGMFKQGGATMWGTRRKLLGVYSGRYIGPSELDAQLGIVWHREEIDKTVYEGQTAKI